MASLEVRVLDLALELVINLGAVLVEEFYPVVLEGVVGGGDHDPQLRGEHAGEMRDGRGGDEAGAADGGADRAQAGDQGGLDHVGRQAPVAADEHGVGAVALEDIAGGAAQFVDDLGRHGRLVGQPAHAVGTEESLQGSASLQTAVVLVFGRAVAP